MIQKKYKKGIERGWKWIGVHGHTRIRTADYNKVDIRH